MFLFTLAFFMGDLYLQTFAQLPPVSVVVGILAVVVLFTLCLYLTRISFLKSIGLIMCAFVLGYFWSDWYASRILSWQLPNELEGKLIEVTGYIASLPSIDHQQAGFLFFLEKFQHGNYINRQNTFIRLIWRHPKINLQVGDQWRLLVKLKRIHAMQNPGGFDYEAWAMQNGLRATGYVVTAAYLNPLTNQLLSQDPYRYPIHFLRQVLQKKLNQYLPPSPTSPWLMALIIGERSHIAQTQWQVLRNTGTNHLMAVAGLHIGMVAGFVHVLAFWCWRRLSSLMLWMPAQHMAAIMAWCAAVLYSALAGFSIPTQRACIMLSVFIFTLLLRRKINAWHSWSLALLIVLIFNPLCVLTESFWLSFGTIALIIYGMGGRLIPSGWWWKWGRVQWVIGLGLIPLTLALFQQCSLVSFLANSMAIPWLGFLILPFCLLGSILLFILPSLGSLLLSMADKSLAVLWILLTWFSQLHFATWYQSIPNFWVLISTIFAMLLLLLPAGFPGRWLGLLWLIPLLFFKPIQPAFNHFWVTLLDVGQGLSVVVQTKSHVLVYDAGAKFSEESDMGERVVLPYLQTIRAKKIDRLVISHGDNDHSGGAQALLRAMPVLSIKTSVVDKFRGLLADVCLRGDTWQWDGVNFSFLYPSFKQLNLGNDSSCVLRIDNGVQSVLLTGDIEKVAEQELINTQAQQLASTILVAPHHGSKTSGLKSFVDAVHPEVVLYAMGYRNHYHFPHRSVVREYYYFHARQFNSVEGGAIRFKIGIKNNAPSPELYRMNHRHYWMD